MPRRDPIARTGLARALSKAGYCSRSQASRLIAAGRVRLNRRIVRDPERPVRIDKDQLQVDGRTIEPAPKVYLC
jgi:23S rRNA pseudouridine2605 synthase